MKGKYPNADHLRQLAWEAGRIMLENFCFGMKREMKADDTPVTVADTAINKMVIELISKAYPEVSIIGEEGENVIPDAEYMVLCDPVDGTIPFCRGIPISAFCIAVIHVPTSTPVSAVIYDPFQQRMWYADKGHGTYFTKEFAGDKIPVTVSKHSTIKNAGICMIWWKTSDYNLHAVCEKLMEEESMWMNPVSIGYFGGILASGELDATIFPGRKGWETAAMQLIAEEAGGKVTDIHGRPVKYGPGGEIDGHIISNGLIHDRLVEIVASCQK